ncbi:hypothetical protein D3C80_1085890 [compost metagenome]
MGDVDHGDVELLVDLLELAPQLPLQVRVDHRQRLVEEDRRHVIAHQAAAHGDFLLFIGTEVAGLLLQRRTEFEHLGDLLHLATHPGLVHALVTQGESQVVEHRHGVVHHRKLKNLSDIACLWRQLIDHLAIEQHLALGGTEQPGNDIEQGRLAAARRPEQGIGAALGPDMLQLAQGIVIGAGGGAAVAVGQLLQANFGHQATLASRAPGAWTNTPALSKTNSLWVGMNTRIGAST